MKARVYIETTVISYLTAWRSRDLVRAAHQQVTQDWWEGRRDRFEMVTSELVILECSAGDSSAAADRLAIAERMPVLRVTPQAIEIADELVRRQAVPENAYRDAVHLGICSADGTDYLLTWNFKHLANAEMRKKIAGVIGSMGYSVPIVCTPEELTGDPS